VGGWLTLTRLALRLLRCCLWYQLGLLLELELKAAGLTRQALCHINRELLHNSWVRAFLMPEVVWTKVDTIIVPYHPSSFAFNIQYNDGP
jgi:hypothetical protein